MEPAEARIAHRLPGRLRLRIPSRRGEADYFAKVKDALQTVSAVRAVDVNPVSASVLVRFEGEELALDQIEAIKPLFRVREEHAHGPSVLDQVGAGVLASSSRLGRVTHGKLDLDALAFLGYACAGVYQITRGHALPAGVTLLHYALDLAESRMKRSPERENG